MKKIICVILALALLISLFGCAAPEGMTPSTVPPETEPETLPATQPPTDPPHEHAYTDTVVPPTCTLSGYTVHVCYCGDRFQDAQVEALGHDYIDEETPATCTEAGHILRACTRCGDTQDGGEIAVLGHSYSAQVSAPTQVQRGYTKYTCDRCGEYYKTAFVNPLQGGYIPNISTESGIPLWMQDSYILRAWEYIGADVEKLRADGKLFIKYGQTIHANVPYPYITGGGSGLEHIADSTTITGYAPNVEKYHRSEAAGGGLVCAGFVTYYVLNYLRWIEGIDCTQFREAMNAHIAASGMNTRGVPLWERVLTSLADKPGSCVQRIYKEAYDVDLEIPETIYDRMLPGDLVTFGNLDSNGNTIYSHIAVYAGEWGGKHFIIHSANVDGPWMGTPEGVGISGEITSHPVGVYRLTEIPVLHLNESPEEAPEGPPEIGQESAE